jgi:hypothetical protein
VKEYRRRVTGDEKSMIALNELQPPFAIQLTLEGDGDPEPTALYDALTQATTANPGSAVRLEQCDPDDFWVPGPPPTLTVVDAPDFTAEHGDDAPFLRWPLDASTGPTCELVHVRGKTKAYLIFRALHAVMDGQGTLLWALDFLRCLRGQPPVGHPSTLDVHTLCDPVRDQRRPTPQHDALHPLGLPAPGPLGGCAWRRVHISRPLPPITSGRIAVALAELAWANSGEPGPVRIHLPTDLRAYAKEERTTGNLFGSLFLEVEPGMTAADVGLQIVRMLYAREGQRPLGLYAGDEVGSLAAHRVKRFRDLSDRHGTGRYATSATLSHLGKLDGAPLSGPRWTATSALYVPPVGDACDVSVNGFDEHTEVVVGLSGPFNRAGQIDGLAEVMRQALTD